MKKGTKMTTKQRGAVSRGHRGQIAWNKGTSKIKEKDCLQCLKSFLPRDDSKKFCSAKCFHLFNKGRNNGSWKGGVLKKQCIICGNQFSVYPYRKNQAITCSTKCMGMWQSKNRIGEKSGFWKGGITPINRKIRTSKEYKLWRKAVFERDNFTCIWCGAKGGNGKTVVLNADHIKPFAHYPELRFAIDNGRTLCVPCHKKTDTFGGKSLNKDLYE